MTLTSKSRKQILIAMMVVIGLVGGVWWLTRSTPHTRFIGHWAWTSDRNPTSETTIRFDSDGRAELRLQGLVSKMQWWAEDDELIISPELNGPLSGLIGNWQMQYAKLTSQPLPFPAVQLQIIAISDTEIRLALAGRETITLRKNSD
jgi:hypothetical protein